jgi:hypothetical protein
VVCDGCCASGDDAERRKGNGDAGGPARQSFGHSRRTPAFGARMIARGMSSARAASQGAMNSQRDQPRRPRPIAARAKWLCAPGIMWARTTVTTSPCTVASQAR